MLEIVHELVVELAHDLADHRLELREVNQESGGIKFRAFQRHAHAIIVAVHVLALPPVTAQGMPCRKSLFYANLKHVSPELRYTIAPDLPGSLPIRKDLPIWPPAARRCRSHPESARHLSIRASSRIVAATLRKFYHRACAEVGCPAAQARRGLSSPGSSAQIPASTTALPAAPGIPQTGYDRRPAERALSLPRSGHSAQQTGAGRR